MSVASRNPFALLNEDEVISTPPPASDATKAPVAPQKKDQPQKGPSSRGGRYYQRGGGTKSAPREESAPAQEAPGDRFAERTDRGRGRGRGGFRGRGEGGRGRGRDPRPDRHSQTGRIDTEKRVNSGWGADEGQTELAAEQSGEADATADAQAANDWGTPADAPNEWGTAPEGEAKEWGTAPEGEAKEGEDQGEYRQKEEEEDNTMTLSEYLAKKKASEVLPSKPEGRAANEGADNLWKDAVQLQRDSDEENYYVGKTKSAPKARARKEEKVHIEIEARFAPIERGRGRGGGRGRGERDNRGRGGFRGGEPGRTRRNDANLDVSDETAFPSLS